MTRPALPSRGLVGPYKWKFGSRGLNESQMTCARSLGSVTAFSCARTSAAFNFFASQPIVSGARRSHSPLGGMMTAMIPSARLCGHCSIYCQAGSSRIRKACLPNRTEKMSRQRREVVTRRGVLETVRQLKFARIFLTITGKAKGYTELDIQAVGHGIDHSG